MSTILDLVEQLKYENLHIRGQIEDLTAYLKKDIDTHLFKREMQLIKARKKEAQFQMDLSNIERYIQTKTHSVQSILMKLSRGLKAQLGNEIDTGLHTEQTKGEY